MTLQTLPFLLGAVAVASLCVAAAIYFLVRAKPLAAWKRRRQRAQQARSELSGALAAKRVAEGAGDDKGTSTLLKILDKGAEAGAGLVESTSRPRLPPPPSRKIAAALEKAATNEFQASGNALEAVIVQMYEEYLTEIARFQRDLGDATSVGEILNKTCRVLSRAQNAGRLFGIPSSESFAYSQ